MQMNIMKNANDDDDVRYSHFLYSSACPHICISAYLHIPKFLLTYGCHYPVVPLSHQQKQIDMNQIEIYLNESAYLVQTKQMDLVSHSIFIIHITLYFHNHLINHMSTLRTLKI